jgi:arylsulfatase A-like enzyme
MPLYVRWPGTRQSGTVTEYVTNVDLAPTLAAIGGTRMGTLANGLPTDGLDVSAVFRATETLTRTALLEERAAIDQGTGRPDAPGWRAIRTTDKHELGLWHYIEWANGATELYDLARDPHELESRRGNRYSQIRAGLAAELEALYRD